MQCRRQRDVLIHDYFGVDVETVWMTIKEKVPVVILQIKHVLEKMEDDINEES